MALYAERGFDRVTVAEIAERAGLTERTFYRHFADKREVLFAGADTLKDRFVAAVASAPDSVAPLKAAAVGLEAVAGLLEERRAFARQRRAIIAANPDLLERELIKLATMSSALADTLRERGVGDPAAGLTAEVAIAIFKSAWERWTDERGDRAFAAIIRDSLEELKAVTAA